MSNINKEELHSIFIGIKKGSEADFNKLYQKYKKLVYGVAFSILKNKEDSEEATQSVFMKIFKLEKDKLPTKNEASWLYSITKNKTLNFLKNKKEEVNIDEIYYIAAENKELNEIIEKDTYNKIISKLNKKEQEIVSLKILSNLSFKEISKLLNMKTGTVQWRYYKALHTLKILLSSLSMYLVTIIAFIAQRHAIKWNRKENKEEIPEKIKEDETDKIELEPTKKEEQSSESLRVEDKDVVNEKLEEITIKTEENTNFTAVDIGLISISSIFLVITIIFLIFSIKSQQKAKKKMSK